MNLPGGHLLQNGKYRLTHVVGQGGFGITYRGVWYTEVKGSLGTVKTEVPICVKEYFFKDYCYREPGSQAVKVHSETGKVLFNKFKEKLIKEAKILSEVHHPYIVNVLEVFEENNTAYIAMEYISGFSLKYMLEKNGILPEATILKYVRQIGEALQFVHDKSILHLDIKPSNILIDKNGNARLIDFGVSKRYDIEQEETSTTMLTLSKGFASIEQYDNEGIQVFSPRPDIYSLGATMYNLLTGKIPTESILRAARPLQNPSEINAAISPKTEAVIIKAMQIIPADRFETVGEMLASLDFSQAEKEVQAVPSPSLEIVNEETTMVYSSPVDSKLVGSDDEETVVNVANPPAVEPITEKNNSRKKIIPIGIVIFVVVGSATALLVHSNRPTKEVIERIDLPSAAELDSHVTKEVEMPDHPVQHTEPPISEIKEAKKLEPKAEEKQPTGTEHTIEENVLPDQPSENEMNEKYNSLIISGKEKMAKADYLGAKKDLSEAKDTKLTEEVVRLIITCDEKAEEKHIADQKALYEEKMAFGRYKIVRKKSNNRYGAIDSKAEERIPCKYLSVGIADNGRAFEREDNLFDIYNSDGSLISEGLTYY
ncbi:serine/threonine-protein kinase [Parabacteroides distasonis]|uniref:Serine/threonine protein kinase n=1 Tax=Parabacteroides distasonis TaxID=823 RepID=A0A3L7ZTE8_PARDI|nr:serine/threonine-protein kinase [Parabacteroides distasonis]NBH89183.1 serine/threonine protein kinase [Parabacteroides distasonis]RLT74958.1 serine/threonine protein kinase [Parabacteroides distasonis]